MNSVNRIYYFKDGDAVTDWIVYYLQKGKLNSMNFIPVHEKEIGFYPYPEGRIPIEDEKAILIWGDGAKHGISYFFRPNVQYFKSVDDAHRDFIKFIPEEKVHCVNHNTALSIYDDNLLGIEVLGIASSDKEIFSEIRRDNGKVISSRLSPDPKTGFEGKIIHKSIDLDVVKYYPCLPLCAHGKNSYEKVRMNFEELLKKNKVIRLDIGGLDNSITYKIQNPDEKPSFDSGFKEYEELIELYLDYN